jgi:hypothetical protein
VFAREGKQSPPHAHLPREQAQQVIARKEPFGLRLD